MGKPKKSIEAVPAQNDSRYLNRELSWLEFNQRVLDEAFSPTVPLLERVKFWCITHSNLDEFFEVRVAGLKQQIESEVVERSPDGLTASETLREVNRRVRRIVTQAYAAWRHQLVPALARHGIHFLEPTSLHAPDREWLESYYRREVHPVLTPLSIGPSHPFPRLLNKSLNLIVRLSLVGEENVPPRLGVVQVPRGLPRLVRLPRDDSRQDYVFLGRIIAAHLNAVFPGTVIHGCWAIRLTRNSELYIDEEETSNVLKAVEKELHNRLKGEAVRLEVEQDCPADIRQFLLGELGLEPSDLFVIDGPVNPTRLMAILDGDHSPELREPPFIAPIAPSLQNRDDLFAAIRAGDKLLHHPYESFDTVVSFLRQSVDDPRVLAIKQTLYRTGGDARIIETLRDAARSGKQVTAVVELKARFDEANNILWSRRLEDAGVHVVYGLVGYKIHCKLTLVVRRDDDGIRRYVHVATGNYNPATARLYTDLGLFTCRPDFADDATNLFNLLTGISQFQRTRKFIVSPYQLHERLLELIARESGHARRGLPARIIAKLNSLVDEQVIEALYSASQAGVDIDLIVRGICCLRPGVPGMSDHIKVRSIVDRFLEHSRIYYFHNAQRPEVFLASADWMPRNFFRRIEIAFPIEDGNIRERLISEILAISLQDNQKARILRTDGTYELMQPAGGELPCRSQDRFVQLTQKSAGLRERGRSRAAKSQSKMILAPPPPTR
jgi:polyphosphate kinase